MREPSLSHDGGGFMLYTYMTTTTETAHVYPIETFFEIERLLRKLNMTPADGLRLLAEALADLDRQITEYEAEGDGLPFSACAA